MIYLPHLIPYAECEPVNHARTDPLPAQHTLNEGFTDDTFTKSGFSVYLQYMLCNRIYTCTYIHMHTLTHATTNKKTGPLCKWAPDHSAKGEWRNWTPIKMSHYKWVTQKWLGGWAPRGTAHPKHWSTHPQQSHFTLHLPQSDPDIPACSKGSKVETTSSHWQYQGQTYLQDRIPLQ